MLGHLGQVGPPPLPPVVGPPEVVPPAPVSHIHPHLVKVGIHIRARDVGHHNDASLLEGNRQIVINAPEIAISRGEEHPTAEEVRQVRAHPGPVLYPEHHVVPPGLGLG